MKWQHNTRRLRILLQAIERGTLIPNPPFQRRLVWTNKHKVNLVKTVLEGLPFPEIYITAKDIDPDTGEATENLVDGQQRLMALYQYFKGSPDLKLDEDLPPFECLNADQKTAFHQYEVVIRDLGTASKELVIDIFTRINSTNYALKEMEKLYARFDGKFKQFSLKVSNYSFFEENPIFTHGDIKRMEDLQLVLTYIISSLSTYFNRNKDLEYYLNKYNEEIPDEKRIEKEIKNTLKFIKSCKFPKKSRCWSKYDILNLLVEVHKLLHIEKVELNPVIVGEILGRFYDLQGSYEPDDDDTSFMGEYYQAWHVSGNTRSNRQTRGRIINEILRGEIVV